MSPNGFNTFESLKYERERLNTYIDWPIQWLSPKILASAGLYYLREQDHVSCVFCYGIIGSWQVGDNPNIEHKRHFKHCPFVRDQPVGNIPLELGDLLSSLDRAEPSYKPCLPVHNTAKRSDYITMESRLKTYMNYWPTKVKQDVEILADAGFYYYGLTDHVMCYHCGQGLRNWQETDNPYKEHALWYPFCEYIHSKNRSDFIKEVQKEPTRKYIEAGVSGGSSVRNHISSNQSYIKNFKVTTLQIEKLMQLDIMRAVVKMGFEISKVKHTLKKRLESTGAPFLDLETVVEQILKIEVETSFKSVNSNIELNNSQMLK